MNTTLSDPSDSLAPGTSFSSRAENDILSPLDGLYYSERSLPPPLSGSPQLKAVVARLHEATKQELAQIFPKVRSGVLEKILNDNEWVLEKSVAALLELQHMGDRGQHASSDLAWPITDSSLQDPNSIHILLKAISCNRNESAQGVMVSENTDIPSDTSTPVVSPSVERPDLPEQGLGAFRRFGTTPSETPLDWLHASRAQMKKILEPSLDPSRITWVDGTVLFTRSILFASTYDRNLISSIDQIAAVWRTWDVFTSLCHYKDIASQLRDLCDNIPLSQELEQVFALDFDEICINLFLLSLESKQFARLVDLKGKRAQTMLDLLQLLLDFSGLHSSFKTSFINILFHLSRKSELYPESLVQRDISLKEAGFIRSGINFDVQKGTFRGHVVAVKLWRIPQFKISEIIPEVLKWRQLQHVNVLPLICLHFDNLMTRRLAFVYPWMKNGNCVEFLLRVPDADRTILISDVAKGLEYMHSMQPAIIHGKLRAANVMINDAGHACLTDCDLTRSIDTVGHTTVLALDFGRWMSPEILHESDSQPSIDTRSDMYAFACVFYEIFSGIVPFADVKNSLRTINMIIKGRRPSRPLVSQPSGVDCGSLGLDDRMWDIIGECWAHNPEDRPTAKNVVKQLTIMVEFRIESDYATPVHPCAETPLMHILGVREEPKSRPVLVPTEHSNSLSPLYDEKRIRPDLSCFRRFSSRSEDPLIWLSANQVDIKQVVESDLGLTSLENLTVFCESESLFKRLIIYTFQRCPNCSQEFRDYVAKWQTLGTLRSLVNYNTILAQFVKIHANRLTESKELQAIIALDLDVICVWLYSMTETLKGYEELVALRNKPAQAVLDLLQALVDCPSLDPLFKSSFRRNLLRLSKKSGLYPAVLVRDDIILEGRHYMALGGFADVWKGYFQGAQVAIKILKLTMKTDYTKYLKDAIKETIIWRQLQHKNVMRFLCLYHIQRERRQIGLVSPWMSNGNLCEYLNRTEEVDRISLAVDAARGLEYLHSMQPTIIHGDLKGANVLISDDGHACLADFGLSTASTYDEGRKFEISIFTTIPDGGTLQWTAPELLSEDQQLHDTRSDMYAFACVCYEIFSGNFPWYECQRISFIHKVVIGKRPPRPSLCEPWKVSCESLGLDDETWGIIEMCWKQEAGERLKAKDAAHQLSSKARRFRSQKVVQE